MNKGRLRGAITARTRYLGRSTNTALDSSRLQRPVPASSRVCRKIQSGHSLKGVCVIEERLDLASNEEQSGRFADSQTRKVGEKFTSVFNFSEKIYKNVSEGDKKKGGFTVAVQSKSPETIYSVVFSFWNCLTKETLESTSTMCS